MSSSLSLDPPDLETALRYAAEELADDYGHNLGPWQRSGSGRTAAAVCEACQAEAEIVMAPSRGVALVSGPAVDAPCRARLG